MPGLLILLLVILIGILAGTITGLIPGIHTNTIAILLLASTPFLSNHLAPLTIAIFLVSMAITHTFVDFIPSIFLGAPDEDTALSTMPGHDFLLKGRGHEAIILTLYGSSIAIALTILLFPICIYFFPTIYPFIQKMMSWFLIWISIFLISKEHTSKLWAITIFLLAGFLGIATLNIQISQPLLPLLTGLFGSSTLIYSISRKTKIPKQKTGHVIIQKKDLIKPAIATALVSPICSFLPGLGSSQAAIISSNIIQITKKQFMILLGSINTLVMSISFITLYTIHKSRTGTAKAISQIISLSLQDLIYILIAITLAAAISIFITLKLSKFFSKNINKFHYSKISLIILALLTIIIITFSGLIGFLIFITSSFIGLTCIYAGIRRSHLMGALLLPTILIYLPFV